MVDPIVSVADRGLIRGGFSGLVRERLGSPLSLTANLVPDNSAGDAALRAFRSAALGAVHTQYTFAMTMRDHRRSRTDAPEPVPEAGF